MSKRNPKILGVWGDEGTRVLASESKWREPLQWDKEAAAKGEKHLVFCASLADIFENWTGRIKDVRGYDLWYTTDTYRIMEADDSETPGWAYSHKPVKMNDIREKLFDLIEETPHLIWQLLTKRPENMLKLCPEHWIIEDWPANVWAGCTVEYQSVAEARIKELLRVPAAVRFLSCEPLLEPVDLIRWMPYGECNKCIGECRCPQLSWVIVGGETGPGHREMRTEWIRDIVQQCQDAEVPVFIKQDSGAFPGRQGRIPDDLWALKEFPS